MIFGINTDRDISKLSQISLEITYNNFEISLVVFMPNITTDHAITYTNRLNIFPAEILQKMSKYPPKFSKYLEKSRIFVLKISRFWIP